MHSDKKVSVVTVSKRMGWEKMMRACLDKQTHKNWEWIVVTENHYNSAYLQGDQVKHVYAPPKTRASNLSASNNEGLRHCTGEYVLFYQDYIQLPARTIKRLLELSDENTFVGTVTKNPPGELEDGRYLGADCPRPAYPEEWETNVAMAPMSAIRELGGYDEEYDQGFAWDNVNLACRAEMLGYKFVLDESIRPQLLPHKKVTDIQPNGEFHAKKMEAILSGKAPIKLNYLV